MKYCRFIFEGKSHYGTVEDRGGEPWIVDLTQAPEEDLGFHLEHGLDATVELRCFKLGADYRHAGCACDLPEARRQSLTLRHENGWNGKGEKQLQDLLPLNWGKGRQISDLSFAEDLEALR